MRGLEIGDIRGRDLDDEVGGFEFGQGAAGAFLFDRVAGVADASGVADAYGDAVDDGFGVQDVSGGAGRRGGDAAGVAQDRVGQAGFADVGGT